MTEDELDITTVKFRDAMRLGQPLPQEHLYRWMEEVNNRIQELEEDD